MLLVIVVRRAFFCGKARRRVYIELLEGDGGGPGSRQCGLLRKGLYGTLDAAPNLGMRAGRLLGGDWLAQATSEHVPFSQKRRGESALRSKETCDIETQMIGEAADLNTQLQIPNRTVRSDGFGSKRTRAM